MKPSPTGFIWFKRQYDFNHIQERFSCIRKLNDLYNISIKHKFSDFLV